MRGVPTMKDRLMEKLVREARFYSGRNERLLMDLVEANEEISRVRSRLAQLKKDLKRSDEIMEILVNREI